MFASELRDRRDGMGRNTLDARALKVIQRVIKSSSFVYIKIKPALLRRWTNRDDSRCKSHSNFIDKKIFASAQGLEIGEKRPLTSW
jgi:hypothetical protein